MVTISGYAERVNKEGKPFYSLTIQGGLEMVLSEESGRYYATAKQATVTSTFDEKTCQGARRDKASWKYLKGGLRALRIHGSRNRASFSFKP